MGTLSLKMKVMQHALCALLAAITAKAQVVTLNFDSLTRGTVLTNQLQASNVLVSGVLASGGWMPGTVLDVTAADDGVFDFGGSSPQAILYGVVGDQVNFNFVLPNGSPAVTDFVSIRVGDGDASAENFRVTFYAYGGAVLNFQEFTTTSGASSGGATVTYSGSGINRVSVLGIGSLSGGAVDDLSFNAVTAIPEPAAAVAALGLCCLAFALGWRRRL